MRLLHRLRGGRHLRLKQHGLARTKAASAAFVISSRAALWPPGQLDVQVLPAIVKLTEALSDTFLADTVSFSTTVPALDGAVK